MKIKYLDGNRLYHAVLAGGQAIIRDKNYLNKINVFPVPDSDTGTNMASTMRAIAEKAKPSSVPKNALGSIAEAAIIGARGNSGLIFAQFLYGLSEEVKNDLRLTTAQFAESARRAVRYARQALLTPVEGTMITVIHDWAEAIYDQRQKMSDFAELLSYSLSIAEKSLRDTPKKLAVLARAGVVDAGAKGFLDFLQGVAEFIQKGSLKRVLKEETPILELSDEIPAERSSVTRRYCTEALLGGDEIDVDSVRTLVQAAGESAIVAGSRSRLRLHVHTDVPADLFLRLKDFGTITDVKADDMLRQYESAHQRKFPVAILTDSTCDLPQKVLDEFQIHLIPFSLFFGDDLFLDKITISPEQFYQLLKSSQKMPTSAQPSQTTVQRTLEFLANHYESIIVITISEKLTGLYGQVLKAMDVLRLERSRIAVLNSKNLSVSQALIVLRAATAIRAGKSHAEIAGDIPDWIRKTKLWVDIKTLKYMVRGGRVSPLKGLFASALNIKPIITLDEEGKAMACGKSFSRRQNMKKIASLIQKTAAGQKVWNFGIVHAQNPIRAVHYADVLSAIIGKKPAFVSDISPVVGVHNGIGVVGVALMFE